MIQRIVWREQEAVRLENESLQAVVLPSLGGKIASLFYKPRGFQLAAQPNRPYTQPGFGANFSDYDASGLDDVFPSVSPSHQQVGGRWVHYPDHGEIWSARFSHEIRGDRLLLSFQSQNLPYQYQKAVSLKGNRLCLQYHITNTGASAFPCLWLFHGLVRYEEDMKLSYPKNAPRIVNVLGGTVLGAEGEKHERACLPHALTRPAALAQEEPRMLKYYLDGQVQEGRCGYHYPSAGVSALLEYDVTQLPYLGLWVTAGGYREECNCAFEPATGFYDDIETARRHKALPVLQPGNSLDFTLHVQLNLL